MHNFTPIPAIIGGAMIGFAAAIMLIINGKIAGISGIIGSLSKPVKGDRGWRIAFIAGLVAGPLVVQVLTGQLAAITIENDVPSLITGGLLVGFGTRLGSGCTSGHGVCGISRWSTRSIVATLIFMLAGVATVYIIRHGLA